MQTSTISFEKSTTQQNFIDNDFLASADESIAHYEATGLHVTLDEMKEWLKAKKLNRNTPMPVAHT